MEQRRYRFPFSECEEYGKAVFADGGNMHLIDEDLNNHETTDECGISATPLIVGGEKASRKEFPHMVRIYMMMFTLIYCFIYSVTSL